MMKRKVTVIVPTHNSEKYISECVESIMHQTYDNIQIICVDSSKDNTINILTELQQQDERIQIIQDANGSYGHKLNVGIEHADGDYIAIVESDDYILPEMYEEMLNGVEGTEVDYIKCATNHFADIGGSRRFFKEPRGKVEENLGRVIDLDAEPEFAWMCLPRIWTALYRKEFLAQNGIWANETPAASFQDTSFTNLVAALAKKCVYKDGAFYCYRNDNVGSSVKSKEKLFCVCDEYKYAEEVLQCQGRYDEATKAVLLRRKLETYQWNAMRLSAEGCEEFQDGIHAELEADFEGREDILSNWETQLLTWLLDKGAMQAHRKATSERLDMWQAVLQKLDEKRKCVLIGAGVIGENVLWVHNWLDKDVICSVADNDKTKNGQKIAGYQIESVESVVEKHTDAYYLIANKKYGKEIMNQLIDLGISEEQILVIDNNIGKLELMTECIRHYS